MARKLNGWQRSVKLMREGMEIKDLEPAAFETLVSQLGLTEEQAADDPRAQRWIQKWYTRRFVPEAILNYLGLRVTDIQAMSSPYKNLLSGGVSHKWTGATQRDSV